MQIRRRLLRQENTGRGAEKPADFRGIVFDVGIAGLRGLFRSSFSFTHPVKAIKMKNTSKRTVAFFIMNLLQCSEKAFT